MPRGLLWPRSLCRSCHFKSDASIEGRLERGGMSSRCPDLQFRVTRRRQLYHESAGAQSHSQPLDDLGVAAIESFGQPNKSCQHPDNVARLVRKSRELVMRLPRHRLAVIPRDERDRLDLIRCESPQATMANQVVGMFVMPLVADVRAD